jgi:hypothetical protein
MRINSGVKLSLQGRLFSYQFAFVEQFAFADVCAVANVEFSGRAVFAQGYTFGLIMGPSLGAALLRVSAFGIGHSATLFFVF